MKSKTNIPAPDTVDVRDYARCLLLASIPATARTHCTAHMVQQGIVVSVATGYTTMCPPATPNMSCLKQQDDRDCLHYLVRLLLIPTKRQDF